MEKHFVVVSKERQTCLCIKYFPKYKIYLKDEKHNSPPLVWGYAGKFFLNIVFCFKHKIFCEFCSWKNVCFSEQIMFVDKCASMFYCQREAMFHTFWYIVILKMLSQVFSKTEMKMLKPKIEPHQSSLPVQFEYNIKRVLKILVYYYCW